MNRTVETRCVGPSKFPYSFSFAPRLDSAREPQRCSGRSRRRSPTQARSGDLISALPFVLGLAFELHLCDDIALPEVGAGPLQIQP
jgi:hypothetical protein